MILPVSLIIDQPWTLPLPSTSAILAVLGLSLVSTAFAYFLFFRILATAGATNTSLVTLLVPPSAIILGVAFLGEHLQPTDLIGMLMIGFGLMLLDGRLLSRLRNAA